MSSGRGRIGRMRAHRVPRPAPRGDYYTKTEDDHPVFHLYSNLLGGGRRLRTNKETALKRRLLCKVCGKMNPKP
jgi:hypothetical protein